MVFANLGGWKVAILKLTFVMAPATRNRSNTTQVLAALQEVTRSIPVVFAVVPDPVENGFVASLARPGGNITGFTSTEDMTSTKWPELLKEIDPHITRLLVLFDPRDPSTDGRVRAIEAVVSSFKMQLTAAEVRDSAYLSAT
jgi:putative tryptophan/tyrosine transport system substrate-binding protein